MQQTASAASIGGVTYSLDDFLRGRPERILHAAKTPKILLVWQHGNEELGPRVAHYIFTQRPDLAVHIDYICGDPIGAKTQSAAAQLGYDVNRSYEPDSSATPAYAQQRAQEILTLSNSGGYDYVLDLHTSNSELEQFFIVPSALTPLISAVVGASMITKVVALPAFLTNKALIGYAANAVAIEMNEVFAETPQATQEVVLTIEALAGMSKPRPVARDVFYVDSLVPKNQDPGDDAENFKLCKDGYYPILLGKGKYSYRNDPTKDYICFGASRKEQIVL